MFKLGPAKCFFLFSFMLFSTMLRAQAVPWLDEAALPANSQPFGSSAAPSLATSESMAPQAVNAAYPSTVTIPAGTRVMLVLKSPLHTTSGTAGSGIYLETLYPVIFENRVVIPAHTEVQGVVEADRRPGHFNRNSEFRFRFTSMIFPNNHVAPIQGVLQSIPGAKNIRTHGKSGTLQPVDQAETVIIPAAVGAVGGAIIGAESTVGIGKFTGAGLGAALGLGAVLLKRGDEISLARGTNVEMVLQAPLSLEQSQVAENARYVAPPSAFSGPANAAEGAGQEPKQRRRPQHRPAGLPGLLFPIN